MSIIYGVLKEVYVLKAQERTSYGIIVYDDLEGDGTPTILAVIRDISSDRKAVEGIVKKCNVWELSLIHFRDVVEDFFTQ